MYNMSEQHNELEIDKLARDVICARALNRIDDGIYKPLNPFNQPEPFIGGYVLGVSEIGGLFYVCAVPREDCKTKWRFEVHFSIASKELNVLKDCNNILNEWGEITSESSKNIYYYSFDIYDPRALKAYVIPFFKQFCFRTPQKQYEFTVFEKLVTLMLTGVNTIEDLNRFLIMRKQINLYNNYEIMK
jgi:hypothetical protein